MKSTSSLTDLCSFDTDEIIANTFKAYGTCYFLYDNTFKIQNMCYYNIIYHAMYIILSKVIEEAQFFYSSF